jgi:5-epi-alpha-selinene synthase
VVAALPSFGAAQDAQLRRFVSGLWALVRGNLDWSKETPRYQAAQAPAQPIAA